MARRARIIFSVISPLLSRDADARRDAMMRDMLIRQH